MWGELGRVIGERGLAEAAVNYGNHWGLLEDVVQREDVKDAITKLVVEVTQKAINYIHRIQKQHEVQLQQFNTQLQTFSKLQFNNTQSAPLHPVSNTNAIKKLEHLNK